MNVTLVLGVVVLACLAVTSAKPARQQLSPLCRKIRSKGCPELKNGKVCGTDGQTYRNECLLRKKACKESLNLDVDRIGGCDVPANPQQAGGNAGEETVIGVGGEENERGDTPDGRDAPDTPDAPDGQDPNPQAGGDPTEAPQPTEAAEGGSSSGSSSEEAAAGDGGAGGAGGAGGTGGTMAPATSPAPISPGAKVCPDKCPKPRSQDLVCGTDGQNYGSPCLLQQHVCRTNETVGVQHRGNCNTTCGEECPLVYEPVCGTDGLTYMSRCDLLRTACLIKNDTLQVAYNQECVDVAALKDCPECPASPEPVCSTKNMTFRSQCEFERFVCIFEVVGIDIANNDSCTNAPLICPNYCEGLDPVCGTDGVEYNNDCELGVADCHAREENRTRIGFASRGPCPEGTPDPCSPDSPDCELIEDPVCARKGKKQTSYYNRCFYEKEVCFDPTIKFISEGRCIGPANIVIEPELPIGMIGEPDV